MDFICIRNDAMRATPEPDPHRPPNTMHLNSMLSRSREPVGVCGLKKDVCATPEIVRISFIYFTQVWQHHIQRATSVLLSQHFRRVNSLVRWPLRKCHLWSG